MKLIIINGPVGVGKTTVSKKLLEKIPMAFFIQFDELRKQIGAYKSHRDESRVFAFELSFALVEECLKNTQTVIIDKMMYERIESGKSKSSIDQLYEIANKYHVDVVEILLWADKDTMVKRLESRGFKQGGLLTREKAIAFWHEMEKFKQKRKQAIVIDTSKITENEAFEQVVQLVS
jgi:broad-specificity NMP kinase